MTLFQRGEWIDLYTKDGFYTTARVVGIQEHSNGSTTYTVRQYPYTGCSVLDELKRVMAEANGWRHEGGWIHRHESDDSS